MDAATYPRYNLRPRTFAGTFTTSHQQQPAQPRQPGQTTPRIAQKVPKRPHEQGPNVPTTPEPRDPVTPELQVASHSKQETPRVKRKRTKPRTTSRSSAMDTTLSLPSPASISTDKTAGGSRRVHWGQDSIREFNLNNPIFSLSSGPSPTQQHYSAALERGKASLGSPFSGGHRRTLSRTFAFYEIREMEQRAQDPDFVSQRGNVRKEKPKVEFDEIIPNLYMGA